MHLEVEFKDGTVRSVEVSSSHVFEVKGTRPLDPSDPGTVDSFSFDGVVDVRLVGGKPEPAPVAPVPAVGPAQETRGGRLVA